MAHGCQEFSLVGYSEYLERRPLKFVEPIPASRICSACNSIPRLTYTLLCGHTFCEPCYEGCATTSEYVCPLDGDVCDNADVTRKEYPASNLLRWKVHCWNEVNGCPVVLPASQVAEHVNHDCQHHVTRCARCLASVLCLDMCAHLKSLCTALVLDTAPEAQPRAEDNKRTHFLEFDRKIDERVHQLDAKLSLLSSEIASQSEKLVSLCHSNNNLKEALTEQIATASDQTVHRLDRNEGEIKALLAHDKTIEERVGQLNAKLAQLSLKSDSMGDTLTEICQNHTYLKKALAEQLERASSQMLDRFDGNEAEMRTVAPNEKTIKERVHDVDAKLDQLSLESGCQRDRLAEVCQNVNNLKEALIQQFGVACSELNASYTKERESLMTAITSTLASVPCDPKTSQRVVTGYAALKEKALQQGWSVSMSDKVYLLRYALSWGIQFRKEGDGVYLYLRAQLHEGKEDDFLDWPFAKELKLSIIHPKTREERLLRETPDVSGTDRKYYCRPVGGSTGVLCFTKTRVGTSDIESGGYVEGDRLLVRLEVAL